jgi:general secretion pathway protein C
MVWGLVGWSATYWTLSASQGGVRPMPGSELVATEPPTSDAQTVARALGTVAPLSSSAVTVARYKLLGVAAGPQGVALIAVDDQPGRPYRLHAILPDDAQLVALGRDTATLRLSDGQVLNLRVPAPVSDGASVVAMPPEPPLVIGNEQAQVQDQMAVEATAERTAVRGRKADAGGRIERSKDALNSDTAQTLERLD